MTPTPQALRAAEALQKDGYLKKFPPCGTLRAAAIIDREFGNAWRPIVEAPRGELFTAIDARDPSNRPYVARYSPSGIVRDCDGVGIFYPTHFQPLPQPPTP